MPDFDIVKRFKPSDSFRSRAVRDAFSLSEANYIEHFKGSLPVGKDDLDDMDWNIGVIVGGSGTGKTTIAKECFPDAYIDKMTFGDKPVIDEMPKASVKEIELAFTSVGFASPPSWLKPYNVLSNGEKMRVDLAYCLLKDEPLIVFDEFTSVVDRTVAKTTSYAISKAIRKSDKKFVAVSCHFDILDWLEPDWVFDTDEMRFFGRGANTNAPTSSSNYSKFRIKQKWKYGEYLQSIII